MYVVIDTTALMFMCTGSHRECDLYGQLHSTGWWLVVDITSSEGMKLLTPFELIELHRNSMKKEAPHEALDHLAARMQKIAHLVPKCSWTMLQLEHGINLKKAATDASVASFAAQAPPAPPKSTPVSQPARPERAHDGHSLATGSAPMRPKAGSTTGRVWDICDAAGHPPGPISNVKAFKKQVLAICEGEGINPSTGSVQFGKWLLARGSK